MTGLALSLVLGACGGGSGDDSSRITIEAAPNGAKLAVEASLQYQAVVRDSRGNVVTRPVAWTSSNPSVVSVSSAGLAVGIAPGTATVSAASENSTADVSITVAAPFAVQPSFESHVVRPGGNAQFAARVVDGGSLGDLIATVSWSVADETVASITPNGVLTGLAPGSTTVTAAFGSVSQVVEIAVQEPLAGLIAFTSNREQRPDVGTYGGVYVMRSDGTDPTLVIPDRIDIGCGAPFDPFARCRYSRSGGRFAPDGLRMTIAAEWPFDPEQKGHEILVCATAHAVCARVPRPAFSHPLETRSYSWPAWSPDGSRLAFVGSTGIFVWRSRSIETNAPVRIAPSGTQPAWSPDGSRIAFVSAPISDIWVMNADGSQPVQLTNDAAFESSPRWSPDGRSIAFATNRDGNHEIYVMNADGSAATNLTNNPALDAAPDWSPDGGRIAFHTDRDGNFEIYTMNADGSDLVNLTSHPAEDFGAGWSP